MENLGIYYANDNHLSIILSEYLKNKNNERYKIITYFQQEIENKIKNSLLNKTDFIEKRNSNDFKIKEESLEKEIIIIIRGNKEYINNIYSEIIKNNNDIENKKIKIIKCFNIDKQEDEIEENIKENKKFISTSGECNIF